MFFEEERSKARLASGMTVTGLWDDMKDILQDNLSPSTMALYRQLQSNLSHVVKEKRVSSITSFDIERFKLERSKSIEKITVNKELRTMRAFLNQAIRLGFMKNNPALSCANYKVEPKTPAFLTPEEVRQLLNNIASPVIRDIVLCALFTAMRIGEIVNLDWRDIDFQTKFIWVRNKPGFRVKGGRSRIVPMGDLLALLLQERPRVGEKVFLNKFGRPCKVGNISRRFKMCALKAGLPKEIHFHSLRHTSLSWMAENGVPPEYIRQIAGHSSIVVTQIYTHSTPSHLSAAANSLAAQASRITGDTFIDLPPPRLN